VATRTIDGEAIIVLADAGEVQVLNQVGTRIWELADGTRTVQQIAEAIAAEYDVSMQQAQEDTAAFLQELVAMGALVWRAPV